MSWDDLEADASGRAYPGPRCSTGLMLSALDDEARSAITRALANVRLTSSSIHKALESRVAHDLLASPQSINRHRRGACNCPKESTT